VRRDRARRRRRDLGLFASGAKASAFLSTVMPGFMPGIHV
jgi:hypothetical protein